MVKWHQDAWGSREALHVPCLVAGAQTLATWSCPVESEHDIVQGRSQALACRNRRSYEHSSRFSRSCAGAHP